MWQFWIDVGGTFTDCIGVAPDGEVRQFKTLSSGVTKGTIDSAVGASIFDAARADDPAGFHNNTECRLYSKSGRKLLTATVTEFFADVDTGRLTLNHAVPSAAARYELVSDVPAPVLSIRWLLRLPGDTKCPATLVRFGTTRGTNALLTGSGARTALVTTRGFGDVPLIGNQDRPDLFQLDIRKPNPLFHAAFEIDERVDTDGNILTALDVDRAGQQLRDSGLTPDNFDSVAICLLNAYRNPDHELLLEKWLLESGFTEISRSSEVSPLIRFVPRCDTTVLDAYLNPILRVYLNEIRGHLPDSQIQVMTSVGGLVDSHAFRGRDCVLSGPAGGIVGFSTVAETEGYSRTIGFDMGGTSTDVARYDGRFELENETTKAGVKIMTPMLAIETVAAGGGSICGFDGVRLHVGPKSAGASPGPACYGSGGPLTVTDLNVFLGRVLPAHFPFRLDLNSIRKRLNELRDRMVRAKVAEPDSDLHELAEGLLNIANDNMAQAIRKISVAKGYHPAEYALVSFGGAGGQHACRVARNLGITRILIHPFAGILSAYGMGMADVRAIRQCSILKTLTPETLAEICDARAELENETRAEIIAQGIHPDCISPGQLSLELRYRGTDSSLVIPEPADGDWMRDFELAHRRQFGYVRGGDAVEVAAVRIETVGMAKSDRKPLETGSPDLPASPAAEAIGDTTQVYVNGRFHNANVYRRQTLQKHDVLVGPCIVCEPTSTVFIEPGCTGTITATGMISIDAASAQQLDLQADSQSPSNSPAQITPDPVRLEVFNNQFVSIAEQMGETLRRTSRSTNVRERLDFSCALFDREGQLVVNAPHVPVHLGAMGETVRAIISDHPDMKVGDVYVTNDPFRGGSHLPDVTVVTPVFPDTLPDGQTMPDYYVANRAHHAEIGGVVPGSMPPFSRTLAEEGVVISSQKLVDAGTSFEHAIRRLLLAGKHPSRNVQDNLADLTAQVAANERGVRQLRQLTQEHGAATIHDYMQHIQDAAAKKTRLCLTRLEDRSYEFSDRLDDGSRVQVRIVVQGDEATVDFSGTADVHDGNLNGNRAIATAAVLYSFRCLLNEDVPLNAGVLAPISIILPMGLLNPPAGDSPESSPAMVGGNVETSQRIVDVLLGALRLAAASQGTMNNLTFGNDRFGYYETICGGSGATRRSNGADAVHTHMTNTRLTDPEVLEQRYPVRLTQFSIRKNSGGAGRHRGGNGVVREMEFLQPLSVSMLSQRRGTNRPYGIEGGEAGQAGKNLLRRAAEAEWKDVGGAFHTTVEAGDMLRIETPGGGGCGASTTGNLE